MNQLLSIAFDLLFLGSALLVLIALAGAAIAALRGRGLFARRVLFGIALYVAVYAAALVVVAAWSAREEIPLGEEKTFVGFDAHLHYAISSVERETQIGFGDAAAHAEGTFVIVTCRVRSDASRVTIGIGEYVHTTLVDGRGARYEVTQGGQETYDRLLGHPHPVEADWYGSLRPGDSSMATFVFDVPKDATHLGLWLVERGSIGRFVVAGETSPGHAPRLLMIE
jgi:hypothetical protein